MLILNNAPPPFIKRQANGPVYLTLKCRLTILLRILLSTVAITILVNMLNIHDVKYARYTEQSLPSSSPKQRFTNVQHRRWFDGHFHKHS